MSSITFTSVLAQARQLSPAERAKLIVMLNQEPSLPQSHESLWGALAHLGPAPSAEDIDEVRREVWKNFPREDI